MAEGSRHRRLVDRHYFGGAFADAVYGSAVRDQRRRKALFAARGPDRYRICDCARLCPDRHPIFAARGPARLCRNLLAVDADGAADGRLCAPRRGALWPEIRAVAAMGLGRLRGGRARLRLAGRYHRGQAADLGHRIGCSPRRVCQPRAAAAGPAQAGRGRGAGREPFAARSRFPRHHPRRRPDPGQPRRLLHFCLHHLAGVGSGRADHCRAVGVGRAGRDRGVCAVAALHAGAFAVGGDRRAQCGRTLADHRAGAIGCGIIGGSVGAWVDLWTDPGRHHGIAGASRADPYDGARDRAISRPAAASSPARHRSCRASSMPATGRASIT